jgi:subtilase family serine protease
MRFSGVGAVILVIALTACKGATDGVPGSTESWELASRAGQPPSAAQLGLWPRPGPAMRVCAPVPVSYARCQAWIRTDINGMLRKNTPGGYAPIDLQTAYNLTSYSKNNGSGKTVAIVDAYDNPNAASDLSVYRTEFGLPACTLANGCFAKQKYAAKSSSGWAEEESLDVDMVSAICPNCKVLLVEAASASTSALSVAEKYATAHANYVSNSWSANEGNKGYDTDYDVSGVAITAATGDDGYNSRAQWPAILPSVIGVGGTSLTRISPRTEKAWFGAGSGCSTIYGKPSFQSGINTGCSNRAQADASAVADPSTGVAVYDSFHESGWLVFGGTSVSTPMLASVFALGRNASTNDPGNLYSHASLMNDITSGSNGNCGAPLCKAWVGWDGPTGLGTPNGIGAF